MNKNLEKLAKRYLTLTLTLTKASSSSLEWLELQMEENSLKFEMKHP